MVTLSIGAMARQEIRDAALQVELLRAKMLPAIASGRLPSSDVVVFHSTDPEMHEWVMRRCSEAHELTAVSHRIGPLNDRALKSFRLNEQLVQRGVRMMSLFDVSGMSDEIAERIQNSDGMPYYFAFGPLLIKVFDRRSVMLEGPRIGSDRTVMVVTRPDFSAAAMRYVNTVREHAVPAQNAIDVLGGLTARQHQVGQLLTSGHTDDAIAQYLSVSVRTVRAEAAALMRVLGAPTRFAAGAAYAQARSRSALNDKSAVEGDSGL